MNKKDKLLDKAVNERLINIRAYCPKLTEKELEFIKSCLRIAYIDGSLDARTGRR